MTNRLLLALACVLLVVRLPSLMQPMGADQGLYAYVGDRIRSGAVPYRDAWDQKPPAIHVTYAIMRAALPRDAAVPAADLIAAALIAVLLWKLGHTLAGGFVGPWASIVFLFLSNPAFARLGGVSVRAQCETFIAAAVTAAFVCLARMREADNPVALSVVGGALLGIAFAFKYNTIAYVPAALFALLVWRQFTLKTIGGMGVGFVVPVAALAAWFAAGHALRDLYEATITYNVKYSGETYEGPWHAISYLLTFPIHHSRVDALWLVGGAGCAVLLVAGRRALDRLVPVAWTASACLTIAINGSRDLPQYFVQVAPALALAAAWGATFLRTTSRIANTVIACVIVVAIWRVNDFVKLVDNTRHDLRFMLGATTRSEHLARYGDRATRKYSALAMDELGAFMESHSTPADTVFVFGFSSGAYVRAGRMAASRFFWSRPVIVGFNQARPGYGVAGLLDDLRRSSPALVALQQRDWYPDVDDSAHFFMTTPSLANWLRELYQPAIGPDGYDIWMRRASGR